METARTVRVGLLTFDGVVVILLTWVYPLALSISCNKTVLVFLLLHKEL